MPPVLRRFLRGLYDEMLRFKWEKDGFKPSFSLEGMVVMR